MDIEALIEEIDFSKEAIFGNHIGDCRLVVPIIPLDRLYNILANHIPEFKNFIENETAHITDNI